MSECILWNGWVNEYGYGKRRVMGKIKYVHRHAYEQTKGKIPKGLVIDHLCRVRLCINPEHLEAVTIAENTRRGLGVNHVNRVKTHCSAGHLFDATNTHVDRQNKRVCRTCERDRAKRNYLKLRAWEKLGMGANWSYLVR